MEKLRFEHRGDFLELGVVDDYGNYSAYLTLLVSSARFVGRNDLHVDEPALVAFCTALVRLERDRRGVAELVSISPDELVLRVRAIDSAGHMAVEGSTGHHVQRLGGQVWHSVTFGFDFDPPQLAAAIGVDWVRRYAAK